MTYPSPSILKLPDLEKLAALVIEENDPQRLAMAADLIVRRVGFLEVGGGDDLEDTRRLLEQVRGAWREAIGVGLGESV